MLAVRNPGGYYAHVSCHSCFPGVSDVQTNVETKKVLVTADDSVSPQDMLEKLQKVSLRLERRLSAFLCWIANSILLLAVVGSKWKVSSAGVTQIPGFFLVAS